MNVNQLVEQTVGSMGYELVDIERLNDGLMRVLIDNRDHEVAIMITDCEIVSRQLTYLFEVDGIAYERLEVSSPGVDRPLKKITDYQRFEGEMVQVKLKLPMDFGGVARKSFSGRLQMVNEVAQVGEQLSILFDVNGEEQILEFGLADVDKARLVPVYNFKGKQK